MIEELTQSVGTEVLKIIDEVAAVGTTSGGWRIFSVRRTAGGFAFISPPPDKISAFNSLSLGVVTNIVAMVIGDIAPAQTEEPLMCTGVENVPSTSDRVSITIVETGSGSVPSVLTPTMDILEELSLQMVRQFFTTMEYCFELVLSGRSSFEFVQTLLENQVENIKQTRGSDHARAHQVLVKQLGARKKLGTWRELARLLMLKGCPRISVPIRNGSDRRLRGE